MRELKHARNFNVGIHNGGLIGSDGNVVFARIQSARVGSVIGIYLGGVDERDFGDGAATFKIHFELAEKISTRRLAGFNVHSLCILRNIYLRRHFDIQCGAATSSIYSTQYSIRPYSHAANADSSSL